MRIPRAAFGIIKEVARHVLRRPVLGVVAAARTPDGKWLLVRRGDTGEWALPGGTVEWGETLRSCIERELREEAGVRLIDLGALLGVYSRPERDARFHAVTVVVEARVSPPERPPENPLEVLQVGLFSPGELPSPLAHGMADMVDNACSFRVFWE